MKRNLVLMAIFSLFLAVMAVSAQEKKAADFSGAWQLDVSKSKLGERNNIESMTMNVAQTEKELKVETKAKRGAPPEGANRGGGGQGGGQGGGMGRGMGGGGMMGGGGDSSFIYSLDGKETKIQQETQMGTMPVSLKAKFEKDGKLKLSQWRSFETQMGSMSITTKETWTLAEDGKTLTVKRDTETPRGTQSSEMVFTKN